MERVAHDMELIKDIKCCYHIGPLINNFNKCHLLVSSHFLLTCNLTNLLGVVFSFYKKLFALISYQKDTASFKSSSVTNGRDQLTNRPPAGRTSTEATQLINPLDSNLPIASLTQDTLLTGQRASTGPLLTSRNPSFLIINVDKAPPQQNLNFSYAPQHHEAARRPLAPRTTQPQQTTKTNSGRTATLPLNLEADEDPNCGHPSTIRHALTPNDPVYIKESSTSVGSIANRIKDLYLDFCYPHNTYGPPPSGLQHLGRIITGTYS
jgi:hypothetical protein